jgi:hypothetical protein
VVTASQFSLGQAVGESSQVLTREEMERLPNLGDDPLRLLSHLPGATAGDYSATFHVRGGEERELLVRLDGLALHQPFHLRGFLSVASILDPRAIAGIEVLSGGFPPSYGGKLSAVIDMTTRSATAPRHFVLGISLVSFSGWGEGTFDGGSGRWMLSARRGFLDLALRMTDVQLDAKFDPRFWDAFAKGEHSLGDRNTLAISVLAAGDDVGFHSDTQNATSTTADAYGNAILRSAFAGGLFAETALEGGSVSTRRNGTAAGGGVVGTFRDDRVLTFVGARQSVEEPLSSGLALKGGWEVRAQKAVYDHASDRLNTDVVLLALGFPARRTIAFSPGPTGTQWAAFVSARTPIGTRLTAEAGVRGEGATWSGSADLLPRLGLAADVGKGTTLRAAWGLFAQPQGLDELYPEERTETFFPASKVEHRILSLDTALARSVSVRLEAWQKVYRRLTPRWENLFDPIESVPELQGDRIRLAPESAEAKGLELLVRHEGPRLGLFLAWTLSRATERLEGVDFARSWDQLHAVTASVVYRPGLRTSLAATFITHTGWPYTDVVLANGTPVLGPRNEVRHPTYHRLDLRASHRFPLGKGSLRAYIEVMDIYNQRNECCIDSVRLRKPAGSQPTLDIRFETWIGRVPSFGLEWEF